MRILAWLSLAIGLNAHGAANFRTMSSPFDVVFPGLRSDPVSDNRVVGQAYHDVSNDLFKIVDKNGNIRTFLMSGDISPQWVTSGSDLYYNAGSVAIGTTSTPPQGLKVHVSNGLTYNSEASAGSQGYQAFTDNVNYTAFLGVENCSGSGIFGSGDPYAFVFGTVGLHPIEFFVNNGSRAVKINSDATTHVYHAMPVDEGVQINTTASQPTCASGIRGTIWVVQGGAGVADVPQICIKNAADAYVWQNL